MCIGSLGASQDLSDQIFQSIAKYATRVEELRLRQIYQTNVTNIENIGELRNLKVLRIAKSERITLSIMQNLDSSNIHFENLELGEMSLKNNFSRSRG